MKRRTFTSRNLNMNIHESIMLNSASNKTPHFSRSLIRRSRRQSFRPPKDGNQGAYSASGG
jgi:hypothetical protein